MHGSGKSAKRLIRANVRRGLFAPDVLLARGQRDHEAAAALEIGGLSGQSAWHLANELLSRGHYADKRTAVAGRQTEALPFHGDNVRYRGRPQSAKGNSFRNGGN